MTRPDLLRGLDRVALGCVLAIPLMLLHGHGIAEGLIAVADACFLLRSAVQPEWSWLHTPWLRVGFAWWGWLVVCSLPIPMLGLGEGGLPSLLQALATPRFLLLVAAMEHLVLRDPAPRRWLFGIVAASAAYIALQSLIQFAFGHNLYGNPRSGDGELTGPFRRPRAGPPLSRILFPALLPPVAWLLARRTLLAQVAACTLLLAGVLMMVLIGQRMPLLLTLLGLVIVALLLPRLRPIASIAFIGALALVATSAVVSPPAYHRLVQKFTSQMDHFATSQYGELYARALEIGVQNPATGLGFDGFRIGCPLPRYFRPSFDGANADGGGAAICWHHPHNFYFEALANGGFTGLLLFATLALAWLEPLARAVWHDPQPLRVGLFASIAIQLWPIQSTSAFTSMPMGGWFFLLLGWAMAEARYREG